MSKGETLGVIGAGAWGTALAVLHARAGREVTLWARDARRASAMLISRRNDRLPGVVLPDRLQISNRIPDADIFLLTVPMQHLRATLALLPKSDAPMVLCCKGLETGTALLPPEIVQARPTAMLTGPNFAHEIAAFLPAATVLATPDAALRARLMAALKTDTLRLYGSADIIGAALGGAAKNVIAIAAGW